MTKEEKAKIILESMEEYMKIDWNMEDMYVKAIVEGLDKIEKTKDIKNA